MAVMASTLCAHTLSDHWSRWKCAYVAFYFLIFSSFSELSPNSLHFIISSRLIRNNILMGTLEEYEISIWGNQCGAGMKNRHLFIYFRFQLNNVQWWMLHGALMVFEKGRDNEKNQLSNRITTHERNKKNCTSNIWCVNISVIFFLDGVKSIMYSWVHSYK